MKKYTWIITLILVLILGLGFGYLYFNDHAYGAWGDDSPGYLYLAGRLLQGEPLVYQDELVQMGIEHFGDERLARWLTPTHHEIISPDGWLASIYPVGLSYVMYWTASITGDDLSLYSVVPALAALNLVLVFLICQLLFRFIKIKKWVWVYAIFAALTVGLAPLYFDYAISQPMREIPSLFFILLSVYLFLLAFKFNTKKYWFMALLIISVLSLGFSLNIRHTGIAFLPAYICLFALFWDKNKSRKVNIHQFFRLFLIFAVLIIIPLSFTIINSVEISKNKEKFRKKDISQVAVVSNIDHVTSLNPINMFDNQGKFKPGKGGLEHYWEIMSKMSWIPYFMILVILGVIFIWRKNKFLSSFLALWVLGFLALFSMWINPYSRYIIVVFPALAILGSFGLYWLFMNLIPSLFKSKRIGHIINALIILSIIFIYSPAYAEIKENLTTDILKNKAISQTDLLNLIEIGDKINQDNSSNPAVLIFSGRYQYGLSETLETHTGVKTIRMPLEQEKFIFNEEKVKQYLDQLLKENTKLYFWQDNGTHAQSNDFLNNNYKLNEYKAIELEFPDSEVPVIVKVYELTQKN